MRYIFFKMLADVPMNSSPCPFASIYIKEKVYLFVRDFRSDRTLRVEEISRERMYGGQRRSLWRLYPSKC